MPTAELLLMSKLLILYEEFCELLSNFDVDLFSKCLHETPLKIDSFKCKILDLHSFVMLKQVNTKFV